MYLLKLDLKTYKTVKRLDSNIIKVFQSWKVIVDNALGLSDFYNFAVAKWIYKLHAMDDLNDETIKLQSYYTTEIELGSMW